MTATTTNRYRVQLVLQVVPLVGRRIVLGTESNTTVWGALPG